MEQLDTAKHSEIGTDEQRLAVLLKTFSPEQLDFVAERLTSKTDKEAAASAELSYDTVCHWPNKRDVNEAVNLAKQDTVLVAREKLRRLTPKAVDVLDDEMQKGRKRRIEAAKEVLDRGGVVAGKAIDVTSGGQRIEPQPDLGGMAEVLAALGLKPPNCPGGCDCGK